MADQTFVTTDENSETNGVVNGLLGAFNVKVDGEKATVEKVEAAKKASKKSKIKEAKEEVQAEAPKLVLYKADPEIKSVALSDIVPLDSLPIADATLAMREINKQNFDQIYQAVEDGVTLPPVELVNTNMGEAMVDGYHRWVAHEQYLQNVIAGASENGIADPNQVAEARKQYFIPCEEVTVYSEQELMDRAFQANLRHGLQASKASRTRYAIWILQTDRSRPNRDPKEDISVREAARRALVSHVMVLKALKRMADSKAKAAKKMIDMMQEDEIEEAEEVDDDSVESKDADIADRYMISIMKAAKWYAGSNITSSEMVEFSKQFVEKYKVTKEDLDMLGHMISFFYETAPHATVVQDALMTEQ